MVKRWLTPQPPSYDRPGSRLEFFRLNMSMVKRWFTPPVWWTRISSRIFLKIHYVHGQKMIDSPQVWQTRISSRIFFKDSICPWSKDHWPTQLWQTRISSRIFFKDSACAWSKDDWPPIHHPNLQPFVSAGFHIGHHRGLLHERPTREIYTGVKIVLKHLLVTKSRLLLFYTYCFLSF